MKTYRCSSLPILMACPQSQYRPEGPTIEPVREDARLGRAIHEIVSRSVQGLDMDPETVAMNHGIPAGDLKDLIGLALWRWKQIQPRFPNAESECALETAGFGFQLTGHIDIAAVVGRRGVIADYKSGYQDASWYRPQMIGYAALMLFNFDVDDVDATIVPLHGRDVRYLIPHDDVYRFFDDFQAAVVNADPDTAPYRPGNHCQFCQRRLTCPAVQETANQAITAIERILPNIDGDRTDLIASAGDLYGKVRIVESLCQSFRQAVKSLIIDNGPIPTSDGKELRIVEIKKSIIDPLTAWPVLQAILTDEELAGCVTVSKPDVVKAARMKAIGKKKDAEANILALLKAAHAITVESVEQVREVHAKENGDE